MIVRLKSCIYIAGLFLPCPVLKLTTYRTMHPSIHNYFTSYSLPPVSVPESPTIINDPEDFETELFQSISLTCEASGQPDPVYSWYRDELFLFNTSEPDLFIPEAKPEDRGKYTCVAHNIYGSSNTSRPGLVTISGLNFNIV